MGAGHRLRQLGWFQQVGRFCKYCGPYNIQAEQRSDKKKVGADGMVQVSEPPSAVTANPK